MRRKRREYLPRIQVCCLSVCLSVGVIIHATFDVLCIILCFLSPVLPRPPTNTYQPPAVQENKQPGATKKKFDPEDGQCAHCNVHCMHCVVLAIPLPCMMI